MAKFEFEYTEIDGLLYPSIEIDGKVELDNLGVERQIIALTNCITRSKYSYKIKIT